jgi:hypothetical protein
MNASMTASSSTAKPGFRQRHALLSNLINTCVVCFFIGMLMYLMRGRHFWAHMMYAYVIGFVIAPTIALLQHLCANLLLRYSGPHSEVRRKELESHWPGWLWMLPCIAIGVVTGLTGGQALGDWILGVQNTRWFAGSNAQQIFLSVGFTLLVSVVAAYFMFSHERIHHLRMQDEASRRQASEAQLLALQTQLEPHMLFNTLAHLRILIGLRPADAQLMLDELIAYLRATLQASRQPFHPLSTEFDRLQDYLKLMQRRMGTRLQVSLELPAELRDLPVPPMLLQPLVENAIKHGLEPHIDGGHLQVRAERHGKELRLTVQDDGAGLAPQASTSGTRFGTQQVQERLRTQYGDSARFSLQPAVPRGCVATIELPL